MEFFLVSTISQPGNTITAALAAQKFTTQNVYPPPVAEWLVSPSARVERRRCRWVDETSPSHDEPNLHQVLRRTDE
jgi:hypothetical protein